MPGGPALPCSARRVLAECSPLSLVSNLPGPASPGGHPPPCWLLRRTWPRCISLCSFTAICTESFLAVGFLWLEPYIQGSSQTTEAAGASSVLILDPWALRIAAAVPRAGGALRFRRKMTVRPTRKGVSVTASVSASDRGLGGRGCSCRVMNGPSAGHAWGALGGGWCLQGEDHPPLNPSTPVWEVALLCAIQTDGWSSVRPATPADSEQSGAFTPGPRTGASTPRLLSSKSGPFLPDSYVRPQLELMRIESWCRGWARGSRAPLAWGDPRPSELCPEPPPHMLGPLLPSVMWSGGAWGPLLVGAGLGGGELCFMLQGRLGLRV